MGLEVQLLKGLIYYTVANLHLANFANFFMNSVTHKLAKWYKIHQRNLPWRDTKDPYKIWLSEIILQQTRVEQGMPYYYKFVEQYPTVKHLASAPIDEVLKLWQGLGYYSRARNMHAAAIEVIQKYKGKFPKDYNNIRSLKGVGDYTAAAIASLAFDLPHAVVDGNVYRVLSRLYNIDTPINGGKGKSQFAELAEELLDKKNPANHNQAMMELGAICCKPSNPTCNICPIAENCLALSNGTISKLPVKNKNKPVQNRYLNYLFLVNEDTFCLLQRGPDDIWQGLYDLPVVDHDKLLEPDELMEESFFKQLKGRQTLLHKGSSDYLHKLTHRNLHARFHIFFYKTLASLNKFGIFETTFKNMESYAIPRLLDKFLNDYYSIK